MTRTQGRCFGSSTRGRDARFRQQVDCAGVEARGNGEIEQPPASAGQPRVDLGEPLRAARRRWPRRSARPSSSSSCLAKSSRWRSCPRWRRSAERSGCASPTCVRKVPSSSDSRATVMTAKSSGRSPSSIRWKSDGISLRWRRSPAPKMTIVHGSGSPELAASRRNRMLWRRGNRRWPRLAPSCASSPRGRRTRCAARR